jgi:hypothetical protein
LELVPIDFFAPCMMRGTEAISDEPLERVGWPQIRGFVVRYDRIECVEEDATFLGYVDPEDEHAIEHARGDAREWVKRYRERSGES